MTMAANRNSANAKHFRRVIRKTQAACHICGASIDYELPWLDPMAFVIDHVIPLHKGGTDTIGNVKAAHRSCNSKKRARLIAPIVRRSGSLG